MKLLKGFLFAFAWVLIAVSCKNGDSNNSDAQKQLIGKWKIVKITTEENYSDATGAPDDNNIIITFKANGTGSASSVSGGSIFKWALASNNTYINITDSASAQVISLSLIKASRTSFTVKDTSTHPAQWEVFKKQND